MVVLDPMAPGRTLDFFTSSYRALKVRLYRSRPPTTTATSRTSPSAGARTSPRPCPVGSAFDDLVPIKPGQEPLTETHVDLSTALDPKGFGHVIAIIQPSRGPRPPARPS
ncbi:MAG: hypothetical protein IPQ07_44755 [Myxococcales bacterium]|nr:hypothetical protein [Myxococcales bacterium]